MAIVTNMKKFLLAIALLMAVPCFAQQADTKNNVVHVVKPGTGKTKGKLTNSGHSIKDEDGKVYVVYINGNNKLVYKVQSKKYPEKQNTYYLKDKKKFAAQYKEIVADLKKQGITVE